MAHPKRPKGKKLTSCYVQHLLSTAFLFPSHTVTRQRRFSDSWNNWKGEFLQAGTLLAVQVANCSPSRNSYTCWTVYVDQTKHGGGEGGVKEKLTMRSETLSVLSSSRQFKLAKGRNEVIVGPLLVCQLHVPGPDHHNHVHPGFFSCFRLCEDKSTSEWTYTSETWSRRSLHNTRGSMKEILSLNTFTSRDVCQERDLLWLTANPLCNSLIAFCFYFHPNGGVEVTIE